MIILNNILLFVIEIISLFALKTIINVAIRNPSYADYYANKFISYLYKIKNAKRFHSILEDMFLHVNKQFANILLEKARDESGYFGIILRYNCVKKLCKKVGNNVTILSGVYFKDTEGIQIGDNVAVNELCFISGYGGLIIGNNVAISHNCSIITSSHMADGYSESDWNNWSNSVEKKPVVINDNCWIGCGTRILGGSTIGRNVIIGAGAVVIGHLPENTICVGVPAKPVKKTFK
jgi:acetyltransferase-like isoleucine patch superfamily enzyme